MPEGEIRAARLVARCPSCEASIRLARDELGGWRAVGHTPPAPPDGLTVEVDEPPREALEGYREIHQSRGRFRASRRWFSAKIIFLTLFVIVWDGFLVVWYAMALGLDAQHGVSGPSLMALVFPLVHVAVGVGITWYVAAGWLNRTTIQVAEGRAWAEHGPVPVPFDKARPVALEDVDFFDVVDGSPWWKRNKRSQPQWHVVARLSDGRSVPVVTWIEDEHQARFLQQRLERQL